MKSQIVFYCVVGLNIQEMMTAVLNKFIDNHHLYRKQYFSILHCFDYYQLYESFLIDCLED